MSDALHRVTELYERREQEALQLLGEARQRERKAEADLEHIRELGLDYRRNLGEHGRAGITAATLKHWRGFIVQLDHGAVRQQEAVQRVRQQTSHVEGHWRKARLDANAMATVQQRRERKGEVRQRRAEQRQQDEFAARVTRQED